MAELFANTVLLIDQNIPFFAVLQSVVEITTTVTNRYDELDEVVCDLLSSLTNCSLGNGLISQVG